MLINSMHVAEERFELQATIPRQKNTQLPVFDLMRFYACQWNFIIYVFFMEWPMPHAGHGNHSSKFLNKVPSSPLGWE